MQLIEHEIKQAVSCEPSTLPITLCVALNICQECRDLDLQMNCVFCFIFISPSFLFFTHTQRVREIDRQTDRLSDYQGMNSFEKQLSTAST